MIAWKQGEGYHDGEVWTNTNPAYMVARAIHPKDAQQIAALPELLEALEGLASMPEDWIHGNEQATYRLLRSAARCAIAKAKGVEVAS